MAAVETVVIKNRRKTMKEKEKKKQAYGRRDGRTDGRLVVPIAELSKLAH